jgi:ATP-binding cassette subfamily B protein
MKPFDLIKPYFKKNALRIGIGLISLIIVDVLQLFVPRIIKWAVDDLTTLKVDVSGLLHYALYITAVAVLIGIFRFFWRHFLLGTSRLVEEGIRNDLFSHIQTLSAAYFDRSKTGDLMAHATNDIQQVRMAAGMGLVALNDAVVLGAAAVGFMAYINIQLTLFVLIPMPFIAAGTRFFSKRMHKRYQLVQAAFADLTEVIRERFAGIRIIKSYTWEKSENARVESASNNYVKENLDLVKITGSFFPMMLLFTNISLAIVLFLGGRLTILETITPGDFVAFISYLGLLTWPMMALGWVTNLIQRGRASLDRLSNILNTRPEITDAPNAAAINRLQGYIEMDKVSFSYTANGDDRPPVLSDIDLQIGPGEILGITGPPGSGKTSLLNLIPRLYDVTGGDVRVDGSDIRSLPLADLRNQIAFVPQEPFLFAGSIRQNITLGNPQIDTSMLDGAVGDAALTETILSMPKGYDTVVGEKGVILSGGQKQRIALARALLKTAPVLILDDPISQVDLETGEIIINTIRSMAELKTIIIVSHRMSAVRFADRIVTLEGGRIIETGDHDSLIAAGGYYARTYRLQEVEEDWHAN